jgi:hypothetical protein
VASAGEGVSSLILPQAIIKDQETAQQREAASGAFHMFNTIYYKSHSPVEVLP